MGEMEDSSLDIRYSELADGAHLKKWLSNPGDLLWYPPNTPKEIEEFAKNWIGFSKYRSSLTATIEKVPVGIGTLYLMPYKKVSHHTMFYMIVDPKHRKKGVGSSLLKNLLHLAKTYFSIESVHVEIFEGSPLTSLLRKKNFEPFARQENYVKTQSGYMHRILLAHFFEVVN